MEGLFIYNNDSRRLLLTSSSSSSSWLRTTSSPPSEEGFTLAEEGFTPAEEGFTPSAANLTAAALLGLLFVLGTAGNLAVLVLLVRRLEPSNFTHLLMLNLVCCDLLCLAALPLWIGDSVRRWELGYGLCKTVTFVTFCSHYANLYTIALMSVQRFMRVLHGRRWARAMGGGGERALLVALWAASCLMTWPSVASFGRAKDGRFDCSRSPRMVGQTLAAAVLDLLFGFVVPFSVMTSFYVCLYRKVKEVVLSGCRRTSQLISRIIVTFVVLWVPIHVVGAVAIAGAALRASRPDVADRLERLTDTFEAKMVYLFPLLRLVIDPFLYAFSFRQLWPGRSGENKRTDFLRASSV